MKKLRAQKGCSLMEMVVCVLLVGLMSLTVTTAVNLANKVYKSSVFESESEVLASTLNTALADIFHYAENEGTADPYLGTDTKKLRVFTNTSQPYYIVRGQLQLCSADGAAADEGYLCYVIRTDDRTYKAYPIANRGTYSTSSSGLGLILTDLSYVYDPNTNMYSGSYTIRSTDSTLSSKAKEITFSYCSIAGSNETTDQSGG